MSSYHRGRERLESLLNILEYQTARGILPGGSTMLGYAERAFNLLPPEEPSPEVCQEARDQLLILRELLGYHYEQLPLNDGLINRCDDALKATPGRGEPSKHPFDIWALEQS